MSRRPMWGCEPTAPRAATSWPHACATGALAADEVIKAMSDSGLRGLGGAGFPAGRKWGIVRQQPAPAPDGRQHRRRRARHLQGPHLPRTRSAPFSRRPADRRAAWSAPRPATSTCATNTTAAAPCSSASSSCLQRRPALPAAADRTAARRRRLHLRRRVRDDRKHRGQARRTAHAPALHRAGRACSAGRRWSTTSRPCTGCATSSSAAPAWFSGFGRNGRKGLRSFSVSGRVKEPGVKLAPAGITLRELVDEFCGGMLPTATSSTPICRVAHPAASCRRAWPTSRSTSTRCSRMAASSARPRSSCCRKPDKARDAALNMMRFFEHESCGQCTPCRVGTGKAAEADDRGQWDHATLEDLNQVMIDASICGLGQAAPNPVRCVQKYFAGRGLNR